jgi:hypothetical protein
MNYIKFKLTWNIGIGYFIEKVTYPILHNVKVNQTEEHQIFVLPFCRLIFVNIY